MPIEWTSQVRAAVGDLAGPLDRDGRSYTCPVCGRAGHSTTDRTGITITTTDSGARVARLTHASCSESHVAAHVERISDLLDGGTDADWACASLDGVPILIVSFRPMEMFVMTDHGPYAVGIAAALDDGAHLAGIEPLEPRPWWRFRAERGRIELAGDRHVHLVALRDRHDPGWRDWWALARHRGHIEVIMAYGLEMSGPDAEQQLVTLAGQGLVVEHQAYVLGTA